MNAQSAAIPTTKARLLEAAEVMFIEHGYEAMSLRQITTLAETNLAAVNYHFGSKESLVQELLSKRLDRLNAERLRLLTACEQHYGDQGLDASILLSVLFVPALQFNRDGSGGPEFVRLLGRAYSDTSPFIRNYLRDHYEPIFGRFFEAFARALPHLSRQELGMRLHFSLKALSGVLAGEKLDELIAIMCLGEAASDALTLARLIGFISPMLTQPAGKPQQLAHVEQVLQLAVAAAVAAADASAAQAAGANTDPRKTGSFLPPWAAKVVEA